MKGTLRSGMKKEEENQLRVKSSGSQPTVRMAIKNWVSSKWAGGSEQKNSKIVLSRVGGCHTLGRSPKKLRTTVKGTGVGGKVRRRI